MTRSSQSPEIDFSAINDTPPGADPAAILTPLSWDASKGTILSAKGTAACAPLLFQFKASHDEAGAAT